jgi:soluble lytic murein transglycosylase-like protein
MLHNPATQAVGSLAPVAPDGFAAADQHLAMLGKATDIAARIAAAHQEQARIDTLVARGGLDSWITQALQILDLPQNLAPGVKRIIMAESGGNPRAINLTDSNARRGTPSQGLMQTIPSTFRHYVAPEVANRPITDPVANITAGINYMVENYGINTVAAGGRSNSFGSYIGY